MVLLSLRAGRPFFKPNKQNNANIPSSQPPSPGLGVSCRSDVEACAVGEAETGGMGKEVSPSPAAPSLNPSLPTPQQSLEGSGKMLQA